MLVTWTNYCVPPISELGAQQELAPKWDENIFDTNLKKNLISLREYNNYFALSLIADHGHITKERENDMSKHIEFLGDTMQIL